MEVLEKMERGEIPRTDSPEGLTPSSNLSIDEKRRLEEERDIAEERGEEIDGVTERRNSIEKQPGGEGHILEKEDEQEHEQNRPPLTTMVNGSDGGADSPIPDRQQIAGDETQWREGNHLIIERKVGEGEDVSISPPLLITYLRLWIVRISNRGIFALDRWRWR